MVSLTPDSSRQWLEAQDRLIRSLSDQVAYLNHRTDSLFAAVPDTVRDTMWAGFTDHRQSFWHLTGKDVVSWVVTLLGIGAAAWVARTGWSVTAQNSFQLQEERRRDEVQRRREHVILRAREGVANAARTARATLRKDETHPINNETMNGLILAWQRYDRVSDDIGLMGNRDLEEEVETVLEFGRMIAEKIKEDEASFRATRATLGIARPNGLYVDASVLQKQIEQRQRLRTLVVKLKDIAEPLQARLEQLFPPHSAGIQADEIEAPVDTDAVIPLPPGQQPPA